MVLAMAKDSLIRKLDQLPADRLAEVEDFVDFLASRTRDGELIEAATRLSEQSFIGVCDNPDDAEFDAL